MTDKIINAEIVPINLESEELQQQIEDTAEAIVEGNALFVSGFARLGYLLNIVRQKKYWQDWGFPSFGAYIKDIETRIKKGRSQIYGAISAVDRLLPYADEGQIEKMGITKALELSKMVKLTGSAPSSDILKSAMDSEVDSGEFKAKLFQENNVLKAEDKGTYYDIGGFYATEDEVLELDKAFDLATQTDPPIPQETSEWQRRKEVYLRLSREFIGTYENEVYGNSKNL
jgi:hypothetical protein